MCSNCCRVLPRFSALIWARETRESPEPVESLDNFLWLGKNRDGVRLEAGAGSLTGFDLAIKDNGGVGEFSLTTHLLQSVQLKVEVLFGMSVRFFGRLESMPALQFSMRTWVAGVKLFTLRSSRFSLSH
jgi:hypothetical protein